MAKSGYGMVDQYRCVDCGGPRHPGAARRCRTCYRVRAMHRRFKRTQEQVRRERARAEKESKKKRAARRKGILHRLAVAQRERELQDTRFAQLCVLIREQKEKRKRRERYMKPLALTTPTARLLPRVPHLSAQRGQRHRRV